MERFVARVYARSVKYWLSADGDRLVVDKERRYWESFTAFLCMPASSALDMMNTEL
jgi:hypothetical protein